MKLLMIRVLNIFLSDDFLNKKLLFITKTATEKTEIGSRSNYRFVLNSKYSKIKVKMPIQSE